MTRPPVAARAPLDRLQWAALCATALLALLHLAAGLMTLWPRGVGAGADSDVVLRRIGGPDRIETAVAVSFRWSSTDVAVVAPVTLREAAVDGLVVAARRQAPLFYGRAVPSREDDPSTPGSLPSLVLTPDTVERIDVLGVRTICVAADHEVSTAQMRAQLAQAGAAVTAVVPSDDAACSGSPVAASPDAPRVVVDDGLPTPVDALFAAVALGAGAGHEAAPSTDLAVLEGCETEDETGSIARISTLVEQLVNSCELQPKTAFVATTARPADALVAAAAAVRDDEQRIVMPLTPFEDLRGDRASAWTSVLEHVDEVVVVGGTAAVDEQSIDAIERLLPRGRRFIAEDVIATAEGFLSQLTSLKTPGSTSGPTSSVPRVQRLVLSLIVATSSIAGLVVERPHARTGALIVALFCVGLLLAYTWVERPRAGAGLDGDPGVITLQQVAGAPPVDVQVTATAAAPEVAVEVRPTVVPPDVTVEVSPTVAASEIAFDPDISVTQERTVLDGLAATAVLAAAGMAIAALWWWLGAAGARPMTRWDRRRIHARAAARRARSMTDELLEELDGTSSPSPIQLAEAVGILVERLPAGTLSRRRRRALLAVVRDEPLTIAQQEELRRLLLRTRELLDVESARTF